jgi:hypothetical protein
VPINYELVYKVRKAGLNTNSPSNIEVQLISTAKQQAAKIHQEYADFLSASLEPGTKFEFTNIACMADGILGHVYTWKGDAPRGVGKRVCCFCGCDDFDD